MVIDKNFVRVMTKPSRLNNKIRIARGFMTGNAEHVAGFHGDFVDGY
jgi:hypothetical protein